MENAKMLCPYCSTEFTPDMITEYYRISDGCDTCGYGSKSSITITIKCENCKKVVYKKETIKKG